MGLLTDKAFEGLEGTKAKLNDPSQVNLWNCLDTQRKKLEKMPDEDVLFEAMDTIYQTRNLIRLAISGIQPDQLQLDNAAEDSLLDFESLPVDPELIKGLAEKLYTSAKVRKGETLVMAGAKENIQIFAAIARLATADGVNFYLDIHNGELEAILLNSADDEGLAALAKEKKELYDEAKAKIEARSNPSPDAGYEADKSEAYQKLLASLNKRYESGDLHYSLTLIPTPKDAELDGMEFNEYIQLFFEACDQPWDAIEAAQAKLIEKLDKGKEIRIIDEDGTDLTMSIKDQTFANSVTLKNTPGAEIFTGPVRDSLNGAFVAKGKFQEGGLPLIEDITLIFKNGEVVDFNARVGKKYLEQILAMDDGKGEGVKFVGELGLGGNPHLRRQFINALLVEKVGGSCHLALGGSYQYTEYNDKPVKVDNGNRSEAGLHWDITKMLREKGCKILLDSKPIQIDGVWVDETRQPDPAVAVLNEGWNAMPEDEQPGWWKDRYPNGYESVA